MRLALAQINATVGDFDGNLARIRAMAARARGADLVVLPELALCGYMPRDLLEEPSFLDRCAEALTALAADRDLPPLLVGCALRAEGKGKPVLNVAALLRGGAIEAVAKRLLPTYDVFDERRYFRPGGASGPIAIGGARLGVTVCEDIWTGALYGDDPVADLVRAGATAIVNLSASPYCKGKPARRREIAAAHARRHRVPVSLCNLVGANDQLIFDGNSFALDGNGDLCGHAAPFREDLLWVDSGGGAGARAPDESLREAIVLGIRDYFSKTGFSKALVGMSGGIDSSLVACLAVEALGAAGVTGIGMPGPFSAGMSLDDAQTLAQRLGIRFLAMPILEAYESTLASLHAAWGDRPFDVAEENLQARLRGLFLMSLANKEGALVLAPSNKSEMAMGYCTLYGDMVGALAPIADLYKTEVYALAREYPQIPERSVTRAPTAELAPGQVDQDSLPPYEVLDGILRLSMEERMRPQEIVAAGFDRATVERVLRTVSRTEYKRQQASPVLKLTEKAFGLGRRFPIVERFEGGSR